MNNYGKVATRAVHIFTTGLVESPREDVLLSEIPFSDQKADNNNSNKPQECKIISFNDLKKLKKKDESDKKQPDKKQPGKPYSDKKENNICIQKN